MDTTASTDIVVLDEENTQDTTEDEESSNTPAIAAVAVAAGVAIGTFVVPPVVRWVKGLFHSDQTTDVVEVVEATTEVIVPKDEKTV